MVFDTSAGDVKTLEKKIERKLRQALGNDVAVFIRSGIELREIATFEPFAGSHMPEGAGVNIIFLADVLGQKSKRKVLALRTDTDEFRVRRREVYWFRRGKPGKAIFSNVPLEKALGKSFTIRGADTVKKLVAKYLS